MLMLPSRPSSVRPGIVIDVMLMLPPSGMPPEITDAYVTPGACAMRSTMAVNGTA